MVGALVCKKECCYLNVASMGSSFCQRGENPLQHRKPNATPHNDAGALPRQAGVQQEGTSPLQSPEDGTTHSHLPGAARGLRPLAARVSAPTFWGWALITLSLPPALCTKLEAAGATGHGMRPQPGKVRVLLIQSTVIVAVYPWFSGNRASNCVCCFE